MATSNKQQIGLLFGVKGDGKLSGESGQLILQQLNKIARSIDNTNNRMKVTIGVNENQTRQLIQKQLNNISRGLTINVNPTTNNATNNIARQVQSYERQLQSLFNRFSSSIYGGDADRKKLSHLNSDQWDEYIRSYHEAQSALSTFIDQNGQFNANLGNTTQMQRAIEATEQFLNVQVRLAKSREQEQSTLQKTRFAYDKTIDSITKYQQRNARTLQQTPMLRDELESFRQGLVDGTITDLPGAVHDRFLNLTNQIRQAGGETENLGTKIKRMFSEKFGYGTVGAMLVFARRTLQQMYQNVVQIDTAMTELKKVTNETDESYKRFLDGSTERAQKLGATISDVVTATADFARLGYNLEDASVLSDAATVYKNVGDGITDINEASESIISTMKAFGYEASNVMEIVDKFNTTGNKFSISSGGVGEALLNSASALSAAGNTLDESIALITAANETIQNPEKVGTAMKTLSLYLRAAKTEAEEAGISTDGMANSVSELRDELLALTGNRVDIMISDDDFKSTGQIIIELSKVWSSLSETSQANITELIGGGVRNANVVSALIQNASKIEEIASASANSAGSALEENEKYLDSINGKVAQLEATFQDLSQNVIDSELIKGFVDLGNGALKLVNFLAEIKALLPAIVAGFMSWKNVGKLNSPNMPAYAQLQLVA